MQQILTKDLNDFDKGQIVRDSKLSEHSSSSTSCEILTFCCGRYLSAIVQRKNHQLPTRHRGGGVKILLIHLNKGFSTKLTKGHCVKAICNLWGSIDTNPHPLLKVSSVGLQVLELDF